MVPLPPFALRRGHGVPPPVNTGSPGRRSAAIPLAVGTAYPRRRSAAMHSHVMANIPRLGRVCLACGGKPPERRNRSPSAEGKNHGAPPDRRKVCPLLTIGILRICKAFYKGFS